MNHKLKSVEDLNKMREVAQIKEKKYDSGRIMKIRLCAGGGCIASGSLKVEAALKKAILAHNATPRCEVVRTGCMGPCSCGPVLQFGDVFYGKVSAEDVDELVKSHVLEGKVVERLLASELNQRHDAREKKDEIDFFRGQTKIVLRNCGLIDPCSVEDYVCHDGYRGLVRALDMTSQEIINEVKESGLRGRGGAGFLTGKKWQFTHDAAGDVKYALCNADEGDPGAFMDRSVLEGDPLSIIEGMTIAGRAIGATQGYVYVRAEYPLAVERLQHAIGQARDIGLLGENILGSGLDFDLEIRMGSGAFVCGEETALIASIEGKRGEPRPRPPFPAQQGLGASLRC